MALSEDKVGGTSGLIAEDDWTLSSRFLWMKLLVPGHWRQHAGSFSSLGSSLAGA